MDDVRAKLILKFKSEAIQAFGVMDVDPNEFNNDAPLFGDEGLNLDSLDALELIVMFEQGFDIKIKGKEGSNHIFKSFNSIADHILEKAPAEKVEAYINK